MIKLSASEKTVLQNTRNGLVERNLASGTSRRVSSKVQDIDYFKAEQKSSVKPVVSKKKAKQQRPERESTLEDIVEETEKHGTGSQYTGTLIFSAVTLAADKIVSAVLLSEDDDNSEDLQEGTEEEIKQHSKISNAVKKLPSKAIVYGGRATEYLKLIKDPDSGVVAPHLEKYSVSTQNLANKIYNSERYKKMQIEESSDTLTEETVQNSVESELSEKLKEKVKDKVKEKVGDAVSGTLKTGVKAVKKLRPDKEQISELITRVKAEKEHIPFESVKLRNESSRKAKQSLSFSSKTGRLSAQNLNIRKSTGLSFTEKTSKEPIKKNIQKSMYQKDYAKVLRGDTSDRRISTAAANVSSPSNIIRTVKEKSLSYISSKKNYAWVFAVVGIFAMLFVSGGSIFTSLFSGTETVVTETTYLSADEDILSAESYYRGLEVGLQSRIDSIETDYPGYDEYNYDLENIKHNPYVLISYLSARYVKFKASDVQDEMNLLYSEQYSLTVTETTETEYEEVTEYDEDGDPVLTSVPHEKKILNIKLENKGLPAVVFSKLTQSQKSLYLIYQKTFGNKSYLFGIINEGNAPNVNYHPSEEALSDENFRMLITEAERYLGYPYVWGGASPETSFDCSGYVSWVINHSGLGYNFGRLGSDALFFNMCTSIPESLVRPGDLIFFQRTYDTDNTSHVGIVVGDGMMIHCGGNGVEYTSYKSAYFIEHFYAFGRLHSP